MRGPSSHHKLPPLWFSTSIIIPQLRTVNSVRRFLMRMANNMVIKIFVNELLLPR